MSFSLYLESSHCTQIFSATVSYLQHIEIPHVPVVEEERRVGEHFHGFYHLVDFLVGAHQTGFLPSHPQSRIHQERGQIVQEQRVDAEQRFAGGTHTHRFVQSCQQRVLLYDLLALDSPLVC